MRLLIVVLMLLLVSCDMVYTTRVRNYTKKDATVFVTHRPQKSIRSGFIDTDTFTTININDTSLKDTLVRHATSDSTYYITIPSYQEVMLYPLTLGSAITKVFITTDNDTISCCVNKTQYKAYKKRGIINKKWTRIYYNIN